jgi:hypothetical protein
MQDWRGIELMLRAAGKYGFAIVPEVHQSYDYLYDIRRRADTRDFLFRAYNGPLNEDSARKLSQRAIFNSGFFAMRGDSPVWPVWQKTLEAMLPLVREHHRMVEQNALNVAIYGGNVEMPHRLPAWCNWLCAHALPALDPQSGLLVDPMLPHAPLSVVHMVGGMNADVALDVIGGGTVNTKFNYRAALTLRENARAART